MTAFVTGGSGFIGRSLMRELARNGQCATAPSRADLDLLDARATAVAIERCGAETIYNFASPGVFASADDSDIVIQELGIARNIVEAMSPGTRLIHAGSMAEYGSSGRHGEDDICHPRNAYAEAKYRAGQLLLETGSARGVEVIVARIFGAYGPGEAPRRLLPAVIASLERREDVALSDGAQCRDFVHVADVARAMTLLASAPVVAPTVINVGTGQALRLADVAKRVADDLGAPQSLLLFGAIARSPHDQDLIEADTTRLMKAIGWVPPQRLLGADSIPALMRADPAQDYFVAV